AVECGGGARPRGGPGGVGAVSAQEPQDAGADRPEADQPDADRRGHRPGQPALTRGSLGTSPAASAFRMPRTAWRVRCSFSISAKRTYWSPYSPKPMPGETATFASRSSSFETSSEPIALYASGISAQTNIVAFGFGTCQPMRSRPSHMPSSRLL